MTTINRTKLLECLDHVMDEELKLSRLMHCCLSDSILERETETRLALACRFKEFEAEKAKVRQLSTLKQFSKQEEITDSKPVYTREEESCRALEVIAKKAGVSHMTAFQYDKIQTKGNEDQKEEVATGNSSIKKVYTQIQKSRTVGFWE